MVSQKSQSNTVSWKHLTRRVSVQRVLVDDRTSSSSPRRAMVAWRSGVAFQSNTSPDARSTRCRSSRNAVLVDGSARSSYPTASCFEFTRAARISSPTSKWHIDVSKVSEWVAAVRWGGSSGGGRGGGDRGRTIFFFLIRRQLKCFQPHIPYIPYSGHWFEALDVDCDDVTSTSFEMRTIHLAGGKGGDGRQRIGEGRKPMNNDHYVTLTLQCPKRAPNILYIERPFRNSSSSIYCNVSVYNLAIVVTMATVSVCR